jgi:hypothetical protein
VGNQPRSIIKRILECAALFALSAFLIRLGVCWLTDIWRILLAIAAVTAAAVVGWRLWRSKRKW